MSSHSIELYVLEGAEVSDYTREILRSEPKASERFPETNHLFSKLYMRQIRKLDKKKNKTNNYQ